jgi:hypothetical protein
MLARPVGLPCRIDRFGQVPAILRDDPVTLTWDPSQELDTAPADGTLQTLQGSGLDFADWAATRKCGAPAAAAATGMTLRTLSAETE